MDGPVPQKPEMPDPEPVEIDFDFGFRPDYRAPANPLALIVGNTVGELRRRAIELSALHGEAASLALRPEDREAFLSPERREYLASIHTLFTGGEYLPPYLEHEIEIGRFVLNTPSLDVIAIRARIEEGELHYRVVDEHGGENFSCPPLSSENPLTFAELVEFLDSIQLHGEWNDEHFVEQVLEFNVEEGVEAETLGDFLTAESYHYPELGSYVCGRVRGWLEEVKRNREESISW